MNFLLWVRLSQLLVFFLIVVLWTIITAFGIVSSFVLPSPLQVATIFPRLFTGGGALIPGGFSVHLYTTLTEIGMALIICIALGIPIGFGIGIKKLIGEIYEPLLYLLYSAPSVVLYPLIYLILGVGEASKIAFGVLLGIFPLIINTVAGLKQIKAEYLRLSRSLRLGSLKMLTSVVVPASAPSIVSGLRQCLALVIIGVIAAEVIVSNQGLGWVIASASNTAELSVMYAVIVLVLLIAFGMVEAIRLIERRFLSYVA